jgi:CPA2 family monovalent cation:H+ antiporter-2
LPLRDAFAVLFFVAMGMLLDPQQLFAHLPLTLAALAVVVIVKPLVALGVVFALRGPPRTAITVALALSQIGEFSFIVAALGRKLEVLPAEATQSLVAVSIVSITTSPLLFKLVEPLARRFARGPEPSPDPDRDAVDGHVIVVGYGAVGQQVVTLLVDANIAPTVIDLNLDRVRDLRGRGIRAIYGDASQRAILEMAGIDRASGLVFASNAPPIETVRLASELNTNLDVLTRAAFLRDAAALRATGATVIVSEAEVAFAMAERLLQRHGATPEQLDRARAGVRDEIERLIT